MGPPVALTFENLKRDQTMQVQPVDFEDLILNEEELQEKIRTIIEEEGSQVDLQSIFEHEVNQKLQNIHSLQSIGKIDR
jgi:hypothetical protein